MYLFYFSFIFRYFRHFYVKLEFLNYSHIIFEMYVMFQRLKERYPRTFNK